jgi:drug/metabolite transporter (DMT)-like permease
MTHGPSSNGAVILGILPLVTTVLGALRFKERPSIGFWLSSLVGTGLVLLYALMQGAGQFSYFDGLLIAACVCAAVGYVEGAKLSAIMKPKIVISWALVFSLPISLLFSALSYQTDYIYAGLNIWLSLAYLGIFSMFVGFFFWYEGLRIGGIGNAPPAIRTDQIEVTVGGTKIRLRYIGCPFAPFLGTNQQNVCQGL